MSALCHRCGEDLEASDLFCPNCGAPQVKFEALDESENLPASSRPTRIPASPQGIFWKVAIPSTLLVAVPAGILSAVSVLSRGCCLWVAAGALLSIGLYLKRAPGYRLDSRAGLRIGLLAGLIAALTSTAVSAVAQVLDRFVLHQGSELDHIYDAMIQQSMTLVQPNPDAEALWHTYVHFLLTPDGRAGYALVNAATTSAGIVLFSALGGALGVRIFSARKAPLSQP